MSEFDSFTAAPSETTKHPTREAPAAPKRTPDAGSTSGPDPLSELEVLRLQIEVIETLEPLFQKIGDVDKRRVLLSAAAQYDPEGQYRPGKPNGVAKTRGRPRKVTA